MLGTIAAAMKTTREDLAAADCDVFRVANVIREQSLSLEVAVRQIVSTATTTKSPTHVQSQVPKVLENRGKIGEILLKLILALETTFFH